MFPFLVRFGLTWRTLAATARRPSRSAGLGSNLSFRRCGFKAPLS